MTTLESPRTEDDEATLRPYKGLDFYSASEEDARFFVGRDTERKLIASNLIASRLTVLYGASGVGKSSLLNAGVAYRLREEAERDERGIPEYAVVVFAGWRDDPVRELVAAVAEEVRAVLGDPAAGVDSDGGGLAATLKEWSATLDGELLVILDQCEEFFLYHGDETGDAGFAAQFADAVNDPGVHANFLLSIREDALGRLDLFKDRIPNLFENSLRLDHLGLEAGREAIERPLDEWNDLVETDEPVSIEPALVDEVLNQVRTVETGGEGLGAVGSSSPEPARGRIEAPYLQIVLMRIWRTEREKGSNVLRLATLRELGGAQTIVDERVKRAMDGLNPEEQAVAAGICHYLVSRTGTKIAFSAADLAGFSGLPEAGVAGALEHLTDQNARILRPIAPPVEQPEGTRYELFHDKLATAILEWRAAFLDRQARLEAERKLQAEQAERQRETRNTIIRWAAAALFIVAIALVVLSTIAIQQWTAARHARDQAESRYFAAQADGTLATNPARALALAARGIGKSTTAEAVQAFRATLQASHLRFALRNSAWGYVTEAFSSRGARLLTAGKDGTARIWDSGSGKLVRTLHVGHGAIVSASFSPDGRQIVTASGNGSIELWTIGRNRPVAMFHDAAGSAASTSFSPDGEHVAVVTEFGPARLWTPATGKAVDLGRADAVVLSAGFSPDSTRIVTAGSDGTARIWGVATGRQLAVLAGHRGAVYEASYNPGGTLIVTASGDGTARLWDAATGRALAVLADQRLHGSPAPVFVASFSPDGTRVVTANARGLAHVWALPGGKDVATLTGSTGAVYAAGFSPDGKTIVTGGADRAARLWDATTGKLLALLGGAGGPVYAATFSRDGRYVATADAARTATVWNVSTAPRVAVLRGRRYALDSAEFDRGDSRVVTAGTDGVVRVWNTSGGPARELMRSGLPELAAAFSPDGDRVVAVSNDGTLRVWNAASRRLLHVVRGHEQALSFAAFSPDVRRVVATNGSVARVWNAGDGRRISTLNGRGASITAVSFDDDGARVVTTESDGKARVWAAADGKLVATFASRAAVTPGTSPFAPAPKSGVSSLNGASFSPDGKLIVTASSDDTARVWNIDTRRRVATLTGHTNALNSAAFSPDGTLIVTSSADGTARIWDAASYQLLAVVGSGTGNVLRSGFSGDGRFIVTTNVDGSAQLYNCRFCTARTKLKSLAKALAKQG